MDGVGADLKSVVQKIPCRRCLMEGVKKEDILQKIEEYLNALPLEERTPAEQYQKRLTVCETCSRMENGLCKECGCFVLYRAGKNSSDCPSGRWKLSDNDGKYDKKIT